MKSSKNNMGNDYTGFLAGQFLIAGPAMLDKRFEQSVIYMCAHDETHAMGIIINRPKPDLKLSTMLPHLDIKAPITYKDSSVLYGGPVEEERGFVIHSSDYLDGNNSLKTGKNLALSTSKAALKALTMPNAPKKAIMALGYAGWSSGQLEQEILQNSWYIAPADEHIIFSTNHKDKWKKSLESIGVNTALLSAQSGWA